jgi:hypothetical protein
MKILNSSLSLLLITLLAGVSGRTLVDGNGPTSKDEPDLPKEPLVVSEKILMSPGNSNQAKGDKKGKGKMKKILDAEADKVADDDSFDMEALVDKINKRGEKGKKVFL